MQCSVELKTHVEYKDVRYHAKNISYCLRVDCLNRVVEVAINLATIRRHANQDSFTMILEELHNGVPSPAVLIKLMLS